MRRLLVLPVLLLAGCATTVRTVYVDVPVPVPVPCPVPPPIVPPALPQLSPSATDAETITTLYLALVGVLGHDAELRTLLDGYRTPPATPTPTPKGP